jgi:uncharacterized protein (DUF2126 family)/transglutaminase-like putative cysteine protease
MSIRVALNHKTRYRYNKPVWLSPHVVRLRPAPHCRTPILSYSLKIVPAEHFINWQQDPYSNLLARLVFPKKTRDFSVEVDLVADMTVINPFDFFLEKYAEECPFEYDAVLRRELSPYLRRRAAGPKLQELIKESRKTDKKIRTNDFLVQLNQRIQKNIKYLIRMEPGVQSPEKTLTLGSGSCRDSAWLLVQLMRHLGLAARFVSGYLIQLKPDVKSLDGPSGTDKDFTDLHAWTEVYLPGGGWIGLDPTSGLLAGEGHIPLACSAEPVTAAAISGGFSYDDESIVESEAASERETRRRPKDEFEFSMSVTRILEDPRVTKPYSDEEWIKIESLGHQVDADLKAHDVRLTMGGEPTFVSIDDMDGAEWNMDAVGPTKYKLADTLIRRLRDRFAPGGFLHHGMGKWYPGESLPRWALGLYWRKDGQPIWRDPDLIADERVSGKYSDHDARAFIRSLADRLDVNPDHSQPGYEDAWYYMWKERRLPINVDPFESKLENKEDRARLARVFEQGLEKVVGYALPLRREYYTDGSSEWVSGSWTFRPERMYLVPGDSPMGFRLPLDSIPWVKESEYPHLYEQDPMAVRGPLKEREALTSTSQHVGFAAASGRQGLIEQTVDMGPSRARPRRRTLVLDLPPGPGQSAPWIIRTALCVESRDGILRVFMPPQRYLEDYLALVATVEDTAADMGLPLLVEGYGPPQDSRIHTIKVTPDPGVIEVNIHPSASWDELVKNTTALYEEARLTRLGTEKFMLDGRHTGTGGGNHILVGGACPADSPILRNPALLRSLIGYWHNHPALSYLFSGLFVGPTSQAPRIDEARNDQVYELEVAFQQIPDKGTVPPWIVDRVFRNLLIDASGSTHRAEFCIDKLFAPESASGRLGLLEMRAFEMPPHSRMSLTQHLLLRSLISHFWIEPYKEPLVRWRTEIHDRFMLPYFIHQDLEDVIADLNKGGYPLQAEWFDPHFEFRFPHYGTIEQRGVEMEIRQAIEPWHVLGEEPTPGGTARYVDSSLERMQVLVNGMVDPRHVITCNGHRLPLHPTGTNGQFVAGVRYRAWQPPNCLHPTIGVHSPLIFDVVDTWAGRSIGGCTYYVTHPGGRHYDTFPVNAYEAESRRMARFFKLGHTPGPMAVDQEKISKELPFTLDLRLQ